MLSFAEIHSENVKAKMSAQMDHFAGYTDTLKPSYYLKYYDDLREDFFPFFFKFRMHGLFERRVFDQL